MPRSLLPPSTLMEATKKEEAMTFSGQSHIALARSTAKVTSASTPAPALPLWLMIRVSREVGCPIFLRKGIDVSRLIASFILRSVAISKHGPRRKADLASGAVWPWSIKLRRTLSADHLDTSCLSLGAAKELALVWDMRPTLPAECVGLMPQPLELFAHIRWYVRLYSPSAC